MAALLERAVARDAAAGEISVGDLVERLGLSQPTVSKHLRVLRDHGLVTVRNYTYTQSELKVGADETVEIYGVGSQPARNYFRDGAPLTGQSDHLVNLQLGFEDTSRLSQQTLLINYASKRVTRRGSTGLPDIVEKPDFTLDFVARQGISLGNLAGELKVEVRNITNTKYQEVQENETNRIYYNLYRPGTSFEASFSVKF